MESRRRRFALPIRLRQELFKRLDALHEPRTNVSLRDSQELFRDLRTPDRLTGLPLTELMESLDVGSVPTLDAIRGEARLARSGQWEVFGQPISLAGEHFSWRSHPVSGRSTPLVPWHRLQYMHGECGGDVKFIWELNRHRPLLRLAQAWFVDREDSSADALVRFLDSWMDENPPGHGVNWTSSLEVGYRLITWCWIAALTASAQFWTDERRRRFLWYAWHHGRHVARYDSVHYSPNTHLTGEALALIYIGTCFPFFKEAPGWRQFGGDILEEEVGRQILPDGMHFERSTGYHRYTVEILLHAVALSRVFPVTRSRAHLEDAAERAAAVLVRLRRPDGTVPILGDEDGGTAVPLSVMGPRDVSPLIVLATALFDRSEWLGQLSPGSRDLACWLLPAGTRGSSPLRVRPCPSAPISIPAGGYFAACEGSGTEPWYCLVDGGPHGGDLTGHAHDDCASMEISRGALRLSIDPGSSTYTGDPARRAWDRSAAAHATLLIESREVAVAKGPFGWAVLPPDPETQATDTGAYWACCVRRRLGRTDHDPVHERQTVLIRGYGILVCDWLIGVDGEPIRVTWPMGVGLDDLRIEGMRLQVARRTDIRWSWWGLDSATASLQPHQFAPSYGESTSGAAVLFRGIARPSALIVTSFTDAEASSPELNRLGACLEARLPSTQFSFSPGKLPVAIANTPTG